MPYYIQILYKVVNNEKTQYKIMKNEMEKHNNITYNNNNSQETNIYLARNTVNTY